jgi:hypothetical protein
MNPDQIKSIPMTKEGQFIRKGLLAGLVIDTALVLYSKLAAPRISLISFIAPLVILLVYALLAWFILPVLDRRYPRIIKPALLYGLIAGVIFAGEIILEYILLPADNTNFGYVEYGGVFFVWFLSALMAALASKSLRQGILSAVSAAVIASVIWNAACLLTLHVFHGTSQQAAVWLSEGEYQDFTRSGLKDFYSFTVEDMMGATFYHLYLGLIIAAIIGAAGGLTGKLFARSKKQDIEGIP